MRSDEIVRKKPTQPLPKFMTRPALHVEYSPPNTDQSPADRLLRQIVAGVALFLGAQSLITAGLQIALAHRWLASPSNMAWELGEGWQRIVSYLVLAVHCAYVLGAVMLLRRQRGGILLVRLAAVFSVVGSIVGFLMLLSSSPTYASYWTTPGAIAIQGVSIIGGWLPNLVVIALTLPPLAKRIA